MAERIKIALCLEYPLALRGGVSVLVETLLAGFHAHYDLILVSPDQAEDLKNHPADALLSGHVEWEPRKVSPTTSQALAQELGRRGVRLAHFHIGGNYGWGNRFPGHCPIPYLDKLGIPVISTVHLVVSPLDGYCGPQKPLWFKLAVLPVAWLGKMNSLAHVRHEIAVSHHDETKLKRWYWPLRGKYLQIYHSRLPAQPPPPVNASRELTILNVGHVAWRKGQILLAEAFTQIANRHKDWKLILAGGIAEVASENQIRALAKKHNLEHRIILAGERTDAQAMMQRAGIYVQPSYLEALGLALQEAMFNGCPSIGTRAGGIPELIDHEKTGLLVDVGSAGQMARALDILISNPKLRADYGARAAASIVHRGMTADQMISRHLELYESVWPSP